MAVKRSDSEYLAAVWGFPITAAAGETNVEALRIA